MLKALMEAETTWEKPILASMRSCRFSEEGLINNFFDVGHQVSLKSEKSTPPSLFEQLS